MPSYGRGLVGVQVQKINNGMNMFLTIVGLIVMIGLGTVAVLAGSILVTATSHGLGSRAEFYAGMILVLAGFATIYFGFDMSPFYVGVE